MVDVLDTPQRLEGREMQDKRTSVPSSARVRLQDGSTLAGRARHGCQRHVINASSVLVIAPTASHPVWGRRAQLRRERIEAATPQAAAMLARAESAGNEDYRCVLTEALYRHLAQHGLCFAPDVFEAIDAHNAGQQDRWARLRAKADATAREIAERAGRRCAVCGNRAAGTYCAPCRAAVNTRRAAA